MKRIVASVGLIALGASTINAAPMPSLNNPSKPWSVSASLRGFYDDNANTASDDSGVDEIDSTGFEISPAVNLFFPLEQTTISLGYVYTYKYYDEAPFVDGDHDLYTHMFNASLDHAFSERYQVSLRDAFVIGQEPDTIAAGPTVETPFNVSGDNIRNYASITFNAKLTRLFSLETGYNNALYDYDAEMGKGNRGIPSRSGLLDRLEHHAHLDGIWQALPQTKAVLGYAFAQTDYTGDEPLDTANTVESEDKNSRSHYLYGGADHNFRPDLAGSVRLGARFIDYYNSDDTTTSPYAKLSLMWTYAEESSASLGFTYDHSATDLVDVSSKNNFTKDASYATVFGSLLHRITPKLHGRLSAQFQNGEFNDGGLDGDTETFIMLGVGLEYRFNRHLAANVGYNYDKLDSDASRDYDRNRVFLGVTGSY